MIEAALSGGVIGLYIIACVVGNVITCVSVVKFILASCRWAAFNVGIDDFSLEVRNFLTARLRRDALKVSFALDKVKFSRHFVKLGSLFLLVCFLLRQIF